MGVCLNVYVFTYSMYQCVMYFRFPAFLFSLAEGKLNTVVLGTWVWHPCQGTRWMMWPLERVRRVV